jgi:hypothetical protein
MSFDPRLKRTEKDLVAERNTYLIDETTSSPYQMTRPDKGTSRKSYCDLIRTHEPNWLNRAFFSQKNVDNLQMALRRHVYELSGGKYDISRQSDDHMLLIMRETYEHNARFCKVDVPSNKITQQIAELNTIVLKRCVKRVMMEIEFHVHYLNLIENQPNYGDKGMPGGRPEYLTVKKSNMNRDMALDLLKSGNEYTTTSNETEFNRVRPNLR